jgi:hypothetical protein
MDNDGHPAITAAREEAARQAVWLAMMLLALPLLAWCERKAADPDVMRRAKMYVAKEAERVCARSAWAWWQWAEAARRAYESERP